MSFGTSGTPIAKYFVDDITICNLVKDDYGDSAYQAQETVKGRLIEHVGQFFDQRNEQMVSDGIAHFPADTAVAQGTILKLGSDFYKVLRLVRAKKGGSSSVEFLKCYLEKNKVIAGVS